MNIDQIAQDAKSYSGLKMTAEEFRFAFRTDKGETQRIIKALLKRGVFEVCGRRNRRNQYRVV